MPLVRDDESWAKSRIALGAPDSRRPVTRRLSGQELEPGALELAATFGRLVHQRQAHDGSDAIGTPQSHAIGTPQSHAAERGL